MNITEILHLEMYPLDALDTVPGKYLVAKVRDKLSIDGCCSLHDFVTIQARQIMVRQAESLVDLAYPGPTDVSPYFFNYKLGEELEIDEDHPTKRMGKRNMSQVATDLIPQDHLLNVLYKSPLMTKFFSEIFQTPIYCNQDKYQSLNISVMDHGGCQQWHFDSAQMATTLLLQAPESGGIFEYAPRIRSDKDENFAEVRKVLDGESGRVKQLSIREGSLNIFQGHYSMHRVTEVNGGTRRLQAILGYATRPDLVGNLESSILHYGPRVAEIEKANSAA